MQIILQIQSSLFAKPFLQSSSTWQWRSSDNDSLWLIMTVIQRGRPDQCHVEWVLLFVMSQGSQLPFVEFHPAAIWIILLNHSTTLCSRASCHALLGCDVPLGPHFNWDVNAWRIFDSGKCIQSTICFLKTMSQAAYRDSAHVTIKFWCCRAMIWKLAHDFFQCLISSISTQVFGAWHPHCVPAPSPALRLRETAPQDDGHCPGKPPAIGRLPDRSQSLFWLVSHTSVHSSTEFMMSNTRQVKFCSPPRSILDRAVLLWICWHTVPAGVAIGEVALAAEP